ncbi:hypothetical protein Patl1_22468 [Pistacia atlantica]|uniref:Uncharacterized protein n=1 Tax=Pistacia atlantica TaxID=434234 RepID=A0ACC0ZZN5_9ROSI|nr:hypothetical protein Patl1_22468 [Pistacia atlantica]
MYGAADVLLLSRGAAAISLSEMVPAVALASLWSEKADQCHNARWDNGPTGMISVTSNLVPGSMQELMLGGKKSSGFFKSETPLP